MLQYSLNMVILPSRTELRELWPLTLPFILHIALWDLLYCTFTMPIELITHLAMVLGFKLFIPPSLCKMAIMNKYYTFSNVVFAQMITLISRAMLVTKREWWVRKCTTRNVLLVFIGQWMMVAVFMTPILAEVSAELISLVFIPQRSFG